MRPRRNFPMTSRAGAGLLLVAASAFSAAAQDGTRDLLLLGERIVTRDCARCHGVGRTDESQHGKAPAFRILSARYPLDNLAEALAEGIVTGHSDMPEFTYTPREIDAIIGYMQSLSPPPEKRK